jgi:hypothetical protein
VKLNFSFVFLLALLLGGLVLSSSVIAISDDGQVLDAELQDANSMTWPMLPDESLNDLARLFYPKNQAMRRQFIAKTVRLSADIQPNLNAEKRFAEPTLLVIPTLKSLSHTKNTGRKKARKQKLQLSYDIGQAIEQVPAKLVQEYEWLVSKNAFLKEELAKLNEKIIFLQTKLNDLKLIFDKTLDMPNTSLSDTSLPVIDQPTSNLPTNNLPAKKVFKNLNNIEVSQAEPAQPPIAMPLAVSSLFGNVNTTLIIAVLAVLALLIAGAVALKKYRQHMFASFSDAIPTMSDTLQDFGGHWKDEAQAFDQQTLQDIEKVIQNTEAKAAHPKGVLINTTQNTAAKTVQPNTIQTNAADATLVEAKLLMSVNRSQDAIAHLKLTIDANPKASINHWLYLLEIFRKLNSKEEFEKYAAGLKANFNVTTQAWNDSIAPATMPQHLEEFPNIMEKLYAIWPSDQAKDYLRSLITDSRDGERAGFGKAVLSEILMLIALLDTRKDFS